MGLGVESLRGRDLVSVLDLSRSEIEELFRLASRAGELASRKPLRDRILALAFFEPSTRTRLSFETAMKKLGGETIGFSGVEGTSIAKGETLADTIRMLDSYADAIVIRHPREGAAKYSAEIALHPVINAGDGRQHHPTQALVDLYTVYRLFGRVDGLVYGVLGDLRYARTASSLLLALTLFSPKRVYLVSPPMLRLREEVKRVLEERRIEYFEVGDLREVLPELDVLYVVRIQKERFPDPAEYEKLRGSYRVTLEVLKEYAKPELKVLHPLPRVDEIDPRIDETSYAAYFQQAANGVPIRMALLASILS